MVKAAKAKNIKAKKAVKQAIVHHKKAAEEKKSNDRHRPGQ